LPLGSKLEAAPVYGRARTLQTCDTANIPAALLDGSDAAYFSRGLDSVVVRDLGRPSVAPTTIALPHPVAAAGTTARSRTTLRPWRATSCSSRRRSRPVSPVRCVGLVYDRRTRRLVITLPGPTPAASSLDRQGTLVVGSEPANAVPGGACSAGEESLSWLSPSAPFEHGIAATPCGSYLDVRGDTVIFPRLLASPAGGDVTEEALTTLSGTHIERLVGPEQAGTGDPDGVATFAPNGEIEVLRAGCGAATRIEFYTLARVLRGIPPTARCPLFIEPTATLRHDGSIEITLRCPRGCSGRLTLRTTTGTPIALTPDPATPFELDPGPTTVTASPRPRTARLLEGSDRLVVSVAVQTPASFPASRYGTAYRTTRRVTLHTRA
jgi:hypothetical protein